MYPFNLLKHLPDESYSIKGQRGPGETNFMNYVYVICKRFASDLCHHLLMTASSLSLCSRLQASE